MDRFKRIAIITGIFFVLFATFCVWFVIRMPQQPFSTIESERGTLVFNYTGRDRDFSIPPYVGNKAVAGIAPQAFSGRVDISSVMIRKNTVFVGAGAFAGWQENQNILIERGTDVSGWDVHWADGCNATITDEVLALE